MSAFTACDDRDAFPELADSDCAYVETPLDYKSPETGVVSLFVRRFPASGKSRGQVWLLAGGPGESGASFYADIAFFRSVFKDYDVLAPDHRGTGYSTKLCEPEETRDSVGGLAMQGDEWGECIGSLYAEADRASQFSQRDAARDLDVLITTLRSEGKTFIYAVSYGTSLALEYARLASEPVDGVVLDSLMPDTADTENDLSHRSQVADRAGRAFLEACSRDASCPLGSDANEKYDLLLSTLDQGELSDRVEVVPNGDLRQFFGLLLDVPAARNRIPAIIDALLENDPQATEIIEAAALEYEAYWKRVLRFDQATFSIPLSATIGGSEFNARPELTAAEVAVENAALGFTSPLPNILVHNSFPIYEADDAQDAGESLPPILVAQGMLDPKTPYNAALRRLGSLQPLTEISLITLTVAPHAGFLSAKDCLAAPISDFIADPKTTFTVDCQPQEAVLSFD